jgi:hypothetical protein
MRRFPIFTLFVVLTFTIVQVLAQGSCPELVQAALAATDEFCLDTDVNEACYGNVQIDAELNGDFTFADTGDRVPLDAVRSLAMAGLNVEAGTWGVTLMKVRADIPDTLPGQAVSFLLFGDVQIENAAENSADLTPMQAFYFKSGIGSPDCQEAPDGILVQTPEGVTEVSFTVNGAEVTLGSTAFFQTRLTDEGKPPSLTMSVLEGQGSIEAFGVTQPVFAGSWVRVPIDENFNVAAAPLPPKPYQFDKEDLGILPVNHLEETFDITPSLTQAQIDALLATTSIIGDSRSVAFTIENTLTDTATITLPGVDMLLFAPGEAQTITVDTGFYRATICHTGQCVIQTWHITEDMIYTLDSTAFADSQ